MQCYVNSGMQGRISYRITYARTHFGTEIAKHAICFNIQNRACDPTLSGYKLHMTLTTNSEKCLYLLSELRK
jgi:capsule polysaccharide modification protein KpsS